MGGRGASSGKNGKGLSRETRSILKANKSNILGGKTGTEKQKSYAEKLVSMNINYIRDGIKQRNEAFKDYKDRITSVAGKSEGIKRIATNAARAGLKNSLKDANDKIKRGTKKLKSAKKAKDLGSAISRLS